MGFQGASIKLAEATEGRCVASHLQRRVARKPLCLDARDELKAEYAADDDAVELEAAGSPAAHAVQVACGSRHGSRRGGAPQRKERARGH